MRLIEPRQRGALAERRVGKGVVAKHEGKSTRPQGEIEQAPQCGDLRQRHCREERSPRQKHGQVSCDAVELSWRIVERESTVEGVGKPTSSRFAADPVRRLAKVRGVGIDADDQDIGTFARVMKNEGAVTGSEVDVDRPKPRGELEQSSPVDPALFFAFDEVHGRLS